MSAIPNWLAREQWKAITAPITSSPADRSPELFEKIVAQFHVGDATRYVKVWNELRKRWDTWCNIYLWDLSRAFGCEVPHWVGEGQSKHELDANHVFDWLSEQAAKQELGGWFIATEAEAVAHANAGKFAVAAWKNPIGPGHLAVLMPQRPKGSAAPYSTQAGFVNYGFALLSVGFGNKPVTYFCHP